MERKQFLRTAYHFKYFLKPWKVNQNDFYVSKYGILVTDVLRLYIVTLIIHIILQRKSAFL